MAWAITADPEKFEEASDYFRNKFPITEELATKLGDYAGPRAWTIAGVAQLDIVLDVYASLQSAIDKGTPFDEWQKAVADKLNNAWGKRDSHRIETIFRNATQQSLNAGRWRQMHDPVTLKLRPYGLFDGIDDERQTEVCHAWDGTIQPLDYFAAHRAVPQLHHRCRSSLRNISTREAERRGITQATPQQKADEGFGEAPTEADWKPEPGKYPTKLWAEFQQKRLELEEKAKRPKIPVVPPEHTIDHWEKHYAQQYGDAARAVAHGRAAYERGLDLPIKEAQAELKRLSDAGVKPAHEIYSAFGSSYSEKTLRDEAKYGGPQDHLAALLVGHSKSLAGKTAKIAFPTIKHPPPGEKTRVDSLRKKAIAFYEKLSANTLKHPTSARVFFDKSQRPYWKPGTGGTGGEIIFHRFTDLEHEWAHAIEDLNPRAARRAQAFLDARTRGEVSRRLIDIEPGSGYKPHEMAREDKFLNAYMGKQYRDSRGDHFATEITSMAVEDVSGELMRKDPEMLYFLMGQLADV